MLRSIALMFGFKMKSDLANRIQPPVLGPKRYSSTGSQAATIWICASIWRSMCGNWGDSSNDCLTCQARIYVWAFKAALNGIRTPLVIMDGAGWHQQDLTDDFDNLTLLKLPPYSPELNPIEQVWLRQHYLANRCFKGDEDIVDACS